MDPAGQWALTLSDVSYEQVGAALKALRLSGREWPPTAPEFRVLCLYPDFPSREAITREVMELLRQGKSINDLSPEARYAVVKHTDRWELANLTIKEVRDRMSAAYTAMREDLIAGVYQNLPACQELPAPKAPTSEDLQAAEAKGEETLSQIKSMLGVK